jgi:hypothetical protein
MDTTLTLYDTDGVTPLAFDDDSGLARASRIVWRAPVDGTYYLAVAHYDRAHGTGPYFVEAIGPAGPAVAGGATTGGATGGGTTGGATSGGGTAGTTGGGSTSATLDAPRLYDPKLRDGAGQALLPIELRVGGSGATYEVDLDVRTGGGAVVATLLRAQSLAGAVASRTTWDGRAASGTIVDPGSYTLHLEARAAGRTVATADRALNVVRIGAAAIAIAPAPGTGTEHDYIFHRAGGIAGAYSLVSAASPEWRVGRERASDPGDLDLSDGRPRPAPAPWATLDRPPASAANFSVPAVIDQGSLGRVTVTLGETGVSESSGRATGAGYPISGLPVRLVVNGRAAVPEGLAPGGSATVDVSGVIPGAVTRADAALAMAFEYKENGAWRAIPGGETATVRVYAVLGASHLAPASGVVGAPYMPWAAALDLACGWVGGRARDPAGVATIVADGVFDRLGLYYDRTAGAPAYTYGTLDDLELDLTAMLDRVNGGAVNCSDCATLVATLANMVGCDLDYEIVGWSFTLNDVKGIGMAGFTDDLFRTGTRSAFAFHAAATPDGGASLYDACLSLDGDSQPASAPHTELRPRGLGFARYEVQLTPQGFGFVGWNKHPRLR